MITLANAGAQTLTVEIDGVTTYKEVSVTVKPADDRTPAHLADTLSVTNGPGSEFGNDYVTVVGLDSKAYIIRIYDVAIDGNLLARHTVRMIYLQ
ncbi:hypothetical protein SDC9_165956 [bioreactor metagenome]|uniref:Uncharacterized protein n=1 Tax=bioreactor metagenome TaxID=1076179 RepID=A0A645FXJ2_9ZZZZ